jgi:hypothetical protein
MQMNRLEKRFIKKYTVISIIACILMSNNISLGMFKLLRTQQPSSEKRFYTSRLIGSPPKKNIHNSSELEIATNAGTLLEDMYGRNQRLAELLQKQTARNQELQKLIEKQNIIAINHTYNNEPLDIFTLRTLEWYIREKAQNDFYFSELFRENKIRGHADQ